MPDIHIDLRSDTVTRPTPGMRAAMAAAEVGDDVFDDDPTVHLLQERVADLLGKEAALFVPSGTMSNQLAVKTHTQPGDELICDVNCHIYNYEGGGPAWLSGVTCRTVEGRFGIIDPSQVENWIRPDNEHYARTRLVCLENTHNRGSGRIYPLDKIQAIAAWAGNHRLAMHMDGARLMNAVVASGIPAQEYARHFDSVSICFSKGLGAPIGSALAGKNDFVARARRTRKVFGGGMRQAGILAAAALYALDHNVERLAEDHAHAKILAAALADIPGVSLLTPDIETNLVICQLNPDLGTAPHVIERLNEEGLLGMATAPQSLRFCTHLDISRSQVDRACKILTRVLRQPVLVAK